LKVLLNCASGEAWRDLVARRGDLGLLLSPLGWRQPYCRDWATDNDVFAAWEKGTDSRRTLKEREYWEAYWLPGGIGEQRWLGMLDKFPQDNPPAWVLLPDVVGDWPKTVESVLRYRPEINARGLRAAVALQDGCCFDEALSLQPSTVFVGGSVQWKWRNVAAICAYFQPHGVRVHVGRVSGPLRVRNCLNAGVDSCDGSGFVRFSRKMLPCLFRELDQVRMDFRE
jgi:hypothetical protein